MFTAFTISFLGLMIGMALVKFGNGVSAMSGKVAGNVFARNKAGAYIRNWAKPTSTPTMKQTQVRARFGNQSAGWGALAASERDAWNAAAAGTQQLNRLGDPYVPTGRQMFLKSNNNLAVAGVSLLTAVPADFVPPSINDTLSVAVDATFGVLTTMVGADFNAAGGLINIIEATGQMADIKQNLTNVYRFIGTDTGTATPDLEASWTAVYGTTAVTGNVIWFRVSTVDPSNGMRSSSIIYKATIS